MRRRGQSFDLLLYVLPIAASRFADIDHHIEFGSAVFQRLLHFREFCRCGMAAVGEPDGRARLNSTVPEPVSAFRQVVGLNAHAGHLIFERQPAPRFQLCRGESRIQQGMINHSGNVAVGVVHAPILFGSAKGYKQPCACCSAVSRSLSSRFRAPSGGSFGATPGCSGSNPFALLDRYVLINGDVRKAFGVSGRLGPMNFKEINTLRLADPKHHSRVVAGQETATRSPKARTFFAIKTPANPRPDGVAIALTSDKAYSDPIVLASDLIPQQQGRSTVIVDEDVDAAIIIEVTNRQAASGPRFLKRRTRLCADVFKFLAVVMEQQQWFEITHAR